MSNPAYHTQILLDAARCLLLSGIVTLLGWKLGACLPRSLDWRRWALIVAPLCTPALLVSYAYAPLALRLTGAPWLLNVFYSILMALKLIPLGVIARRMFPSPVSPEAQFCEALIPQRSWTSRIAFRMQVLGPVPWMTGGLAFLLAFTDFELASLLSIKTWTVHLFDAHAGGLELNESLLRVIAPICVELAIILTLILLSRRVVPGGGDSVVSSSGTRWALPLIGLIAVFASGWPIIKITVQSLAGWRVIGVRDLVGEEVLMSLVMALVAALAVWLMFSFVSRKTSRLILIFPGLLGALVLSLVILAGLNSNPPPFLTSTILQNEWGNRLRAMAESPLPLLVAAALLLAPVALLLRVMLAGHRPGERLHLARMAGSRRLIWDLALEPRAAAFGLLFLLGYFEFTAASILAPVQLTPVCVRLHNLAHYGQTSALSAMLFSAMLAPALVLALSLGGARFYARKKVR